MHLQAPTNLDLEPRTEEIRVRHNPPSPANDLNCKRNPPVSSELFWPAKGEGKVQRALTRSTNGHDNHPTILAPEGLVYVDEATQAEDGDENSSLKGYLSARKDWRVQRRLEGPTYHDQAWAKRRKPTDQLSLPQTRGRISSTDT